MILRVLNLDQGEIISHFVCQAKTSPPVAVGNISSFFGLRGNRGKWLPVEGDIVVGLLFF